MFSQRLTSSSQISTNFQCDNCHTTIDQVRWEQCNNCKTFDLCSECAALGYDKLSSALRDNHKQYHHHLHLDDPIASKDIQSISVEEAERYADTDLDQRTEGEFQRIMNAKKIQSDYDMSIVMAMIKKKQNASSAISEEAQPSELYSMILGYHTQAYETDIHILSLDGGGIRGYMPIQVLCQLIIEQHLVDIKEFDPDNSEHRERFRQGQLDFTKKFDYIVGTSTGGLIGFCLAINYDIFNIKKIYADSTHYFKKNRLGPYLWAKYDPVHIHNQIDEIIGTITLKNGKRLAAKDATLLDIHNFLNPDDMITNDMMTEDKLAETLLSHGRWLEFIDESSTKDPNKIDQSKIRHRAKREKVLLITAYNTTTDSITIFNTSYAQHWPYRIADVLKATMAAPTYFPPFEMYKGTIKNGHYVQDKNADDTSLEIFIDGGVFANDPELAALWAIRMQWKKLVNYYLLSIGTGCYNAKLSPASWGGIMGWIVNDGLLVNTLMDATRSLTEIITNNLAKFNNIKRMKFNYKIVESMSLDDPHFVEMFNEEWENLQKGDDYQALVYFYKKYINKKQKSLQE